MSDKRNNLKVWPNTLTKLRLIYALTGESMVSIIDRLVTTELNRLQYFPPKSETSEREKVNEK